MSLSRVIFYFSKDEKCLKSPKKARKLIRQFLIPTWPEIFSLLLMGWWLRFIFDHPFHKEVPLIKLSAASVPSYAQQTSKTLPFLVLVSRVLQISFNYIYISSFIKSISVCFVCRMKMDFEVNAVLSENLPQWIEKRLKTEHRLFSKTRSNSA